MHPTVWLIGALLVAFASAHPPSSAPVARQSVSAMSTLRATPTPLPSRVLFNFADPAAAGRWASIDDPVMGGRSRSTAAVQSGALVFSGTLSLENNGGFASVRARADASQANLNPYTAVRLRVRGDGSTYIFALDSVSDPRLTYWQRFPTTPGAWLEVTLPLRGFEPQWRGYTPRNAPALDPRGILSYGFYIADKQAGPFRLEVARIEAVRAPEAP